MKWGITIDIQRPDLQLRRDILHDKLRRENIASFPEEVIQYIAENVSDSVRELQGMVNSMLAFSMGYNGACSIDIELAKRIIPRLVNQARKVLNNQGVAYRDEDGDLVTSIVNGKDCCFTCYDERGICLCATDRAHREGRIDWAKPISCYLYPIREQQLSNGNVALNYHRWSVCKPAVKLGRELKLPIYKFLKNPLIRRFGQAWYDELLALVEALKAEGMLPKDEE